MPTILTALLNIKKHKDNDLTKVVSITNKGQPRVNKAGDPLDTYIKDSLCNSFSITDPEKKREVYLSELSLLGGQNNPPDIMIRGGDALEVKKVEGIKFGLIALNSSSPKQKLLSDDPMITKECKDCENWKEKDLIYSIGNVVDDKLKVLVFVYGSCYSAKKETYTKIRTSMKEGIEKIGLVLSKTKELGRINQIDPLKRTDLRIRGMWQIQSPLAVFADTIKLDLKKDLEVYAIIPKGKYEKFATEERKEIEKQLQVSKIKIDDPDNPKERLDAVLISFAF